MDRPVAIVTGVGRRDGIAAAIAARLAIDGWDLGITWWSPYDQRMPWGVAEGEVAGMVTALEELGAKVIALEADLGDVDCPARVFDVVEQELGPITALVLVHAESANAGILDTTVESFERHFAVNSRANWLLVREMGRRYTGESGAGRIVALTSDALDGEIAYGASKGALDRIVVAAAREFGPLGITANLINPGPTQTGWIDDQVAPLLIERTPGGRLGEPDDAARIVSFLLSNDGRWITGQLIKSDGGFGA